jgi:hypothetical protein
MLWDFCAWVGVATLTVLSLRIAHGVVESMLVTRVGWTRLEELGFWRAIPVALTTAKWRPPIDPQ